MPPPNNLRINLSHFRAPLHPLPTTEDDVLPSRRHQLLWLAIASYILFCIYIYMLLTQIAKRNRSRRRCQAQNGKKLVAVGFEEEVLIVGIRDLEITAKGEGKWENVSKGLLKA